MRFERSPDRQWPSGRGGAGAKGRFERSMAGEREARDLKGLRQAGRQAARRTTASLVLVAVLAAAPGSAPAGSEPSGSSCGCKAGVLARAMARRAEAARSPDVAGPADAADVIGPAEATMAEQVVGGTHAGGLAEEGKTQ